MEITNYFFLQIRKKVQLNIAVKNNPYPATYGGLFVFTRSSTVSVDIGSKKPMNQMVQIQNEQRITYMGLLQEAIPASQQLIQVAIFEIEINDICVDIIWFKHKGSNFEWKCASSQVMYVINRTCTCVPSCVISRKKSSVFHTLFLYSYTSCSAYVNFNHCFPSYVQAHFIMYIYFVLHPCFLFKNRQ